MLKQVTRVGRDEFELAGNGRHDAAVYRRKGGAPPQGKPLPQLGGDIRAPAI